jgi:hypothetical protein
MTEEKCNVIKANFFWHGPSLSLYESACLSSFVRQGLSVRLHTFNLQLAVPEGVSLVDAGLLAHQDEVLAYTQGGHAASIAAFTDIFRYRVLGQEPGWWFDTDVFCLKDALHYAALERQSKGLLIGFEETGKVNGAVMYISDTGLASKLEQLANAKGRQFDWGAIGPGLVTDIWQLTPNRLPHWRNIIFTQFTISMWRVYSVRKTKRVVRTIPGMRFVSTFGMNFCVAGTCLKICCHARAVILPSCSIRLMHVRCCCRRRYRTIPLSRCAMVAKSDVWDMLPYALSAASNALKKALWDDESIQHGNPRVVFRIVVVGGATQ